LLLFVVEQGAYAVEVFIFEERRSVGERKEERVTFCAGLLVRRVGQEYYIFGCGEWAV